MKNEKNNTIERIKRILFTLLFWFIFQLCVFFIGAIALLQTVFYIINEQPNSRLLEWSSALNQYILEVVDYMQYRSQLKPFPFSNFPKAEIFIDTGIPENK